MNLCCSKNMTEEELGVEKLSLRLLFTSYQVANEIGEGGNGNLEILFNSIHFKNSCLIPAMH